MDYPSNPDANLQNGKFTDGDPENDIPPSTDLAEWANGVTDEILEVLTTAGLTPDENDLTQLRQAILALISDAASSVIVHDASFTGPVSDGDVVWWWAQGDAFAPAIADGTNKQRAVGIADVTNSRVVAFGLTPSGLLSGLDPGQRYWLSDTTEGAITKNPPDNRIHVGIARSSSELFVDIDAFGGFGSAAYADLAADGGTVPQTSVAEIIQALWAFGETVDFRARSSSMSGQRSDSEVARWYGAASDLVLVVDDGGGHVAFAWNAYYDAANSTWRYLVGSQPAYMLRMLDASFGTRVQLSVAPAGTADDPITWSTLAWDGTAAKVDGTELVDASRQATETKTGIAELATQNEVDSGTDDTRIVTPATLDNRSNKNLTNDGWLDLLDKSSGTFSVPQDANYIVLAFETLSFDAADDILIQISTPEDGIITAGYISASHEFGSGNNARGDGFNIMRNSDIDQFNGHMTLTRTANRGWIASHQGFQDGNVNEFVIGGGHLVETDQIDAIRVKSSGGALVDFGLVNLMYWID